jgi:kinetochore protein NDC80
VLIFVLVFLSQLFLEVPTTKYHGGPLERPVGEEDEDSCHYFPYLWLCYEQFWESKDEYPEERDQLEKIFVEKSKQAKAEYERRAREEEDLVAELKRLEENRSPIKIEEEEKEILENDISKFIRYREKVLLPRIKHHEANFDINRKEVDRLEERMQQCERERDELKKQVDAQNVSEDDFERMSRQKEELSDRLKQAMARLHEQSAANSRIEVTLSNKQLGVEKELKILSDNCRSLNLFPFTLSNGERVDDFVVVAGNTSTMLVEGLELDRGVKRKLIQKKEETSALYKEVTSKKIKDQEKYDVVMEDIDGIQEDLTTLATKHKSVKDQYEVAINIREEEARIDAETEASNDLALIQIEQASRQLLDQAELRYDSAKVQMNAVRDGDVELRDQIHREYAIGLETIFSLKTLVTEGLEKLSKATTSADGQASHG